MPQLVLRFPGSFYVCYSGFLCVFEITTAGVTDLKRSELNICQCLTKCILRFNYSGPGMVPIVLQRKKAINGHYISSITLVM